MPTRNRRRLGDLLLEAGLIDETQLHAALNEQRKWGGRLGRTLVELGYVAERAMAEALARQLELPSIDLDAAELDAQVASLLRLDLCERYGVFPLALSAPTRTLAVATADPTNVEVQNALEFATRFKIAPTVATASAIERAIRKYYFGEVPLSAPRPEPSATPPTARIEPVDSDTSFELDALLGEEIPGEAIPARSAPRAPTKVAETERVLRTELRVLEEKVESLEAINASQVRALRVLLELLIESGLVSRDEYLEKLNSPE